MKTATILTGILLLCFCGGLLISATAPQQANAGPDPCTACEIVVCAGPGTCPPGYVPYNQIYGYALSVWPCEFPYHVCRYVQVGCGFPC